MPGEQPNQPHEGHPQELPERPRLPGFDPRSVFEDAPGIRLGEGMFVVGGEWRQVLGRLAACYLKFRDADNRMYFRGVTVIAPPRAAWDHADEDIQKAVLDGMADIDGAHLPQDVVPHFLARFLIVRGDRFDVAPVAEAVAASGERQVVLIPEASKYRDPSLQQQFGLGRTSSLLPEDVWVPHSARLGESCTAQAEPLGSVIVFHAPEDFLVKRENVDALSAVDLLYPLILGYQGQGGIEGVLANDLPRWAALAATGRAQQAYEELKAANVPPDAQRQMTLQIAARAGDSAKVLENLQYYSARLDNLPADTLARFGRMANTHGDEELSKAFLAAALNELNDQMWLETALNTVTSLSASELVDKSWARLAALFPTSIILSENRELRLLKICEASTPQQAAVSRAGFEDFHHFIADTLRPAEQADYSQLHEQVTQRWPAQISLATLCAALHARERQLLPQTIVYAVEAAQNVVHEPFAVRILLAALRRMFLLEVPADEDGHPYKLALLLLLRFLAANPAEARFRAGVSNALSVESAGRHGLPILLTLVLDILAQGANPAPAVEAAEPCTQEQFQAFFVQAIDWMKQQPAVELGGTRLPAAIVGNDAPAYISFVLRLMRYASTQLETAEDLRFLEQCASVVCSIHPYAPEFNSDLDVLRLLAVKFCLQGQPQRARDFAEQMLAVGTGSAQRQRLAWAHYADVYQRTRAPADALIGLSCAALTDAQVEPTDLFQEAYTLLRIARDLNFYELAEIALRACQRLCDMMELGDSGALRLEGIAITLELSRIGQRSPQEVLKLLARSQAHCERVLRSEDELFPAASQFMNIAGSIERTGHQIPAGAQALRAELTRRLGAETTALLRTVSAPVPQLSDVLWLHNRLQGATNSEDAPADQFAAVLAAERLLLAPGISAGDAAVAIELLADKGVELAGGAQPLDAQWPSTFIRDLSLGGLSVAMLATDANDELIAVLAHGGNMQLVRPAVKASTFETRLNAWSADYPFRYGLIEREDGNGEFYSTMQEFELPLPPGQKVLVVAKPLLQQLPFNLAQVGGNFAGETVAIGQAPSLTWLADVQKRPRTQSTARHAWISCSPEAGAYGTLEMVYARLAPLFDEHGFKTDTSGRIPDNVQGAQLAVVTAHGQLTGENRYFHRIADEQHLTASPQALARALADVELVVLFVCSGGRADPHPLANTAVSLPKMLLDRGCRTVIASPWPLSGAVPGNWLECFIKAWDEGDTALDANFKANAYVRTRLGPEAGLGLAMTVYGDVLLRRGEPQAQ